MVLKNLLLLLVYYYGNWARKSQQKLFHPDKAGHIFFLLLEDGEFRKLKWIDEIIRLHIRSQVYDDQNVRRYW